MRIRDYIYAGAMALFFAGLLMSMAGYRPTPLVELILVDRCTGERVTF